MGESNFERMIQLAEEVFAVRNDPDQLDVNEHVIEHLQKIHPCSVSEYDDGNGPVAWILIFPTTSKLMNDFLEKRISEKQLFESTPLDIKYDAIYLCSGLVLPEFRRKGIAKRLALEAIAEMRKDHPIKALFAWAFTSEGDAGAEALSKETLLPLYKIGKSQGR
ncbi:MAG: GCN5-related N-acetyltransferase (GNAT)-like protein [Bacteroidota bacterium]|jgi:ribosomal protein S18 acetylase RimI-like enzyme|nr:GCN5-related N-acetyltransferase (GNAT)-like protein [Bacteroidota bacterium]